jgi:hypothetical protein
MAKRIYRAQSKCHEYLIPTALRCQNYRWLVQNIAIPERVNRLQPEKQDNQIPPYNNPEYRLDEDCIKAYYLSIKNIITVIHNDECLQDCDEFLFSNSDWYDLFKDFHKGMTYSRRESMSAFDMSFSEIKQHLASFAAMKNLGLEKLKFLKLSSYFQHLNHRKGTRPDVDLSCGRKVDYYPTMCLDFSDSIETLKEWDFITKDSVVYSIDLDEVPSSLYYSYLQKYDYKLHTESGDIPINENRNALMKNQHGYCIYWPWKYTVEELQKNKMFDFRVCKRRGDRYTFSGGRGHTPGRTF